MRAGRSGGAGAGALAGGRRSPKTGARAAAVAVALSLLAGLGGCTLILTFDPSDLLEDTPERCRDGVDNDENGLTDCAEPGCQAFEFCQERSVEACRDRVDNDRDGLIDCDDADCRVFEACNESLQDACTDGIDNNGDGLVDCADFTCAEDPHCCHFVAPEFEDALAAGSLSCPVPACVEASVGSSCNAFDEQRWESFGSPAPRVADGGAGFDANRCEDCVASGRCPPCRDAVLLSTARYVLRAGLDVGAMLRVGSGPRDRAGLALTWQTTVEESGPCTDGEPALDRLVGIALETTSASPVSYRVRLVVDGVVERDLPWPSPAVAAFLRLDDDGFVRFYLGSDLDSFPAWDAPVDHRSLRPLPGSTEPLRLALHGHGSGPRVTGLRVQDSGRCVDPVPEARHGLGYGEVFAAGGTGDASTPGDEDAWDSTVVTDPAVVWWQGELHLFYTGRKSPEGLGAIGHAIWRGDDLGFVRTATAPLLDAAFFREHAMSPLAPRLDVYGAAAVSRQEDGALLLFVSVAEREEDEVGRAWIAGVLLTAAGDLQPMWRTLELPPGEQTHELLSPKLGLTESWERSVSYPAVVQRGPGDFVMLYTGRSAPSDPFTAAIGLAVSPDGVHWRRDHVVPEGDPLGENRPVLGPPEEALVQTGVSAPTLVWDRALQIFRVWYVQRVGADFAIHHAVAGPAALSWSLYPGNPVLRPASGTWCDDRYLDGPSAVLEPSGLLRLWYHGRSETRGHAVCYAVNSFGD